MDKIPRICQRSGCDHFLGPNPKQVYCSPGCRYKAWEGRRLSEFDLKLAALNKLAAQLKHTKRL